MSRALAGTSTLGVDAFAAWCGDGAHDEVLDRIARAQNRSYLRALCGADHKRFAGDPIGWHATE